MVVTLEVNRRRRIQCLAVSNQNKNKDEKICETGTSLSKCGIPEDHKRYVVRGVLKTCSVVKICGV